MKYEDAVNSKLNRRNVEPATYNARRLLERPIPNTTIENHTEEESDSNGSSSENDESIDVGKFKCANM